MTEFSVCIINTVVSVQQDLFEIVAPVTGEVEVYGFSLNQISDSGDAAAEALQLSWIRGHTTPGSGGNQFPAVPNSAKSGVSVASCSVNQTTLASAGTGVVMYADTWTLQEGITHFWSPEERPMLRGNEIGVLRQSAPADAITMSGTLYFTSPATVTGTGTFLDWGADSLIWGADSLVWG